MRRSSSANQFDLETLEPRILLSAELLSVAAATNPLDSSAIVVSLGHAQAPSNATGVSGSTESATQSNPLFEGVDQHPVQAAASNSAPEADVPSTADTANSHPGSTSPSATEGTAPSQAATTVAGQAAQSNSTVEQLTEALHVANAPPDASVSGAQAADLGQVIFLDFGGAQDVTYHGPVTITGMEVPKFSAPQGLKGQEEQIIAAVLAAFTGGVTNSDILFTTTRPAEGTEYSTIYIGGDGSAFARYGTFYGLAERDDTGNRDHHDNAFVFSNIIPITADTAAGYGDELGIY